MQSSITLQTVFLSVIKFTEVSGDEICRSKYHLKSLALMHFNLLVASANLSQAV